MATLGEVRIPKKRIATYGKAAVRRRLPDSNFTTVATRSITPEKRRSDSVPSKSPSVAPAESKELKSIPTKSPSRTPTSLSPASLNVFDVPSSEDEALPAPKPARKPSQPSKPATKKKVQKVAAIASASADLESRKRIKLSPAPSLPQKPVPAVSGPKKVTAEITKNAPKLGPGQTRTIASRPKPASAGRKPERARSPLNISSSPKTVVSSTPSPKRTDPDMMDLDLPSKYISPRGQQMWKELLDPVAGEDLKDMLGGGKKIGKLSPRIPGKTLFQPAGVSKPSQKTLRKLPRRRLIDSLVEQTHEEADMDDDDPAIESSPAILKHAVDFGPFNPSTVSRAQSLVPEAQVSQAMSASQSSQTSGPKFTYSRQRSMLAEEDFMSQLAIDMPSQPDQPEDGRRPRRVSIPTLPRLPSFQEEAEEDEGTAAIRSVHELRQAGANNRFLDEIEDFLDRIGKPTLLPSSMRRSGLIDLTKKMKDKSFLRQFRATGVEQRLFVHLGQETDIIAGFLIVSILTVVLVDTSMPHIVTQLRRQGITRLLIRLLNAQMNVVTFSTERKTNMSKIAQSLLLDHHNFLLRLPVWEELKPQIISPRTMALKCLEMMVRQSRESGNFDDVTSKELTTKLFEILSTVSDEKSWDLPQGQQAIDFYLALSALESHSIAARTAHDESIWISNYLPIVADGLLVALSRPVDDFGSTQSLILRLTVNVTNNNPKASDVFARAPLLSIIGQVVVAKFKKILRFLTEDDFSAVFDHLLLTTGVMINFCEWSSSARESLQNLQGTANDPLDSIVKLFVDNAAKMSEADSVVESQKNVAFGYLSVLLGCLCLEPDLAERIVALQPRKTMRPVIASIEEFTMHHKAADVLIEADDDGHQANTALTERFEGLVAKLSFIKSASK